MGSDSVRKNANPLKVMIAITGFMIVAFFALSRIFPLYVPNIPFLPETGFGDVATDVLGEIDNADTPYFTSAAYNNGVNARGMNTQDDIAVDSVNHRLFVSDTNNNRILVYDLDGTNVLADRVADFVLGAQDLKTVFDPSTGAPTSSSFDSPKALAFDQGGSRLFVSDTGDGIGYPGNQRVLVFDVSTITNGEGAVAVLGQLDFDTAGLADCGCGDAVYGMRNPAGIVYDEEHDRLFVSDSVLDRVLIYDASVITNGEFPVNVLNESDFGADDGPLNNIGRLTYDAVHQILFQWADGVYMYDVKEIVNGETPEGHQGEGGEGAAIGANDTAYDSVYERLFASRVNRVDAFDVEQQGVVRCETISGCDAPEDWPTLLTSYRNVLSFVTDSTNGVAYAGTSATTTGDTDSNDGIVLRCVISTGCDTQLEWTTAFQTTTEVASMIFDAVGGVLYAGGQYNNAIIYRCAVSTGCDAQGDWTDSFASGGPGSFSAFAIDSLHNVLYASESTGSTGVIVRCDLSTGCDENTDWVPVYSAYATGLGILFDPSNNVLYTSDGGADSDSTDVVRCETSSGCDDQSKWIVDTLSLDVNDVYGFALDVGSGVLYLGGLSSHEPFGRILRCATASGCDDAGDFTTYNLGESGMRTFAMDTSNGVLYASDGPLFRCVISTGCDEETDWTEVPPPYVSDNQDRTYNTLFYDTMGGSLYSGTSHSQIINRNTLGNFTGDSATCGQAASTTLAGLDQPIGVFYETASEMLYVGDTGNNRMMVWDATTISDCMDATNMSGQLDEHDDPVYTVSGVNNTPNAQGFGGAPGSVAIDTTNHYLYAADSFNNRVLVFALDAGNNLADRTADFVIGQISIKDIDAFNGNECGGKGGGEQCALSNPNAVAVDEAGQRLFVADTENSRVLVFDTSTLYNGIFASNVIGQDDYSGVVGAVDQGGLSYPTNLVFDADTQRLFVGDNVNGRVMVFDVDPSVLIANDAATDGPDAINVIGKNDFVGGGDADGQDGLSSVYGLALDNSTQRLFVADSYNNRVMVFDVDPAVLIANDSVTDGPDAINVIGQDDYIAVSTGTSQSRLNFPSGASFDSGGKRLFVGDATNNRVMVFNADPSVLIPNDSDTDGPDATELFGQPDFDSADAGTTSVTLSFPQNVAYEGGTERLYISDVTNNRIAVYGSPPVFTPPPDTPTPTPTEPPGGGGPNLQAFVPKSIIIEDRAGDPDGAEFTQGNIVNVTVRAAISSTFEKSGEPVNVVLSNDPSFATSRVFHEFSTAQGNNVRYSNGAIEWKRTFPGWDLCFGISNCSLPGRHDVYARFYVNIPAPAANAVNQGQSQSCRPRPVCLDASPVCIISIPAGGWCPQASAALPPLAGIMNALRGVFHLFHDASDYLANTLNLLK